MKRAEPQSSPPNSGGLSLSAERARRLLCVLQDHIQRTLIAARNRSARDFARVAGVTAADTIYRIDRISEEAIHSWFDAHWPASCPVELVMEGREEGHPAVFPRGTAVKDAVARCIIDPIDGTRCLMYDKRSAWILAALAPRRGPGRPRQARYSGRADRYRVSLPGNVGLVPRLGDIVVAAMTELPPSKQTVTEQWSAIRGGGKACVKGSLVDLRTGRRKAIRPAPSAARDFRHGFASLVKFFPDGKALTAQIEEELWAEVCPTKTGTPVVFDDQYLTTGGQIREVLVGHDRMIGDIRPLIFRKLGLASSLVCHPYDICTAMILQEAGGIVEQPDGRALDAPLDTISPVAWMAYASPALAKRVRPVLRRLLKTHLGS